jgi:hypothetical protein
MAEHSRTGASWVSGEALVPARASGHRMQLGRTCGGMGEGVGAAAAAAAGHGSAVGLSNARACAEGVVCVRGPLASSRHPYPKPCL